MIEINKLKFKIIESLLIKPILIFIGFLDLILNYVLKYSFANVSYEKNTVFSKLTDPENPGSAYRYFYNFNE